MKSRTRTRAVKGFVYGGKSRSRTRRASRTMKGFVYGGRPSASRASARTRRAMKSFVY